MKRYHRMTAKVLAAAIVVSSFVCHDLSTAQEDNSPLAGFTALFNGRDLEQWTGSITRDPREIAALQAEERKAWHAKMNKGIHEHWRVEDGVLVSDGDPRFFLATPRDYGDFEMWVDWMIGPKGDSGIYLRGTPQVQIWDPDDSEQFQHGNQKGSGGLWNNKKNERFPTERADKPVGKWNRMYIRMVGPFVTVRLNDKTVVKDVEMENYYDAEIPVFARGPIYLQTHGSETRFRNIFIREIPSDEANRDLAQIAGGDEGFQSVFNGKDLSGWIGAVDDYHVVDSAIQCKAGRGGDLLTKDVYDNFVARLEFKLPPGGNNGLAVRAPTPEGDMAYEAVEIQVLDDTAPQYADLHSYQFHGSLYGLAGATPGYLRPTGEWNFEEVSVDGDHVTVRLNGFEILNADLAKVRQKPADGRNHPGASNTSGHFGFCGHNDPVAFRDIRIKRLDGK